MRWHTEAARAAAYLVSNGMIPAGAAELVQGAVLAEVAELERALGVAWEVEDAAPKLAGDASMDSVRAYMRERAHAEHGRSLALWGNHGSELAPMDAALVRRLRDLGSTKADAEEKHALSDAARMPTGAAWLHWRTWHKAGWHHPFPPAGESWPPTLAEHAMFPLVGLAEGERPGGWRVERVRDSALPPMDAGIEARLTELAQAAEAESGGDWEALLERYRTAVRATDWGDAWAPPRRLVVLARALWEFSELKDEWEERQRKRPALPKVVTREALEILSPSRQSRFPEDDGSLVIDSARGQRVATVDAATVALLGGSDGANKRLDLLERVWFQRLVLLLICRGQTAVVQGTADPRRVVFVGGWQGLREEIGYTESTNRLLETACHLGSGIHLRSGEGQGGGLWTWTHSRGVRGRQGEVAFVLGDALLPGFVFALHEGKAARALSKQQRDDRRLVPMLVEQALPYRLAGVRQNDLGRVLMLAQWSLPLWLRDNVNPDDGTMPLSLRDVERMTKGVNVSASHASGIMRMWAEGDGAAPPLVELLPGGRARLTDEHEAAREFARCGREREATGRARGRKHVARKEAKAK